MIIRKAKLKDIEKVSEYGVELLKQHHSFDPYYAPATNAYEVYFKYFKSCIYSVNRLILVAEENNKLIGYAVAEICSRAPVFKIRKFGLISDIYVEKNFRHHGIAKKFLIELKKWFKSKSIKQIELTVHVNNEIGKIAWSKYGLKKYMIKKRVPINKFNITS